MLKSLLSVCLLALVAGLAVLLLRGLGGEQAPLADEVGKGASDHRAESVAMVSGRDLVSGERVSDDVVSPAFIQPRHVAPISRPEGEKETTTDPMTLNILRYDTGAVLVLDRAKAHAACSARSQRIPTIRELAEYAKTKGAAGIPGPTEVRARNFSRYVARNQDGSVDNFSYLGEGYRAGAPQNFVGLDSENALIWSSSYCTGCVQGTGETSVFVFDARTGEIHDKYDSLEFGVACVK